MEKGKKLPVLGKKGRVGTTEKVTIFLAEFHIFKLKNFFDIILLNNVNILGLFKEDSLAIFFKFTAIAVIFVCLDTDSSPYHLARANP